MRRLEFTRFCHKNPLYTPLHGGSLAVHTCDIAFDDSGSIKLITKVMILYAISKRLVANDSQLKIILSAGTYSINEFNQKMKDAIKGEKWVAAQIKDYKLIIPEHHTFVASALLFEAMGVSANFLTNMKSLLTTGKYQTTLKPPPKKITLHCQEIDKFHNEIDSQPSTQLFSLDAANYAVHYTPSPPIYLPLSSSSPLHSLHSHF